MLSDLLSDLNETFIMLSSLLPYLLSLDIKIIRYYVKTPESGFEPESKPRQGLMIGHYTTRAEDKGGVIILFKI